MPFHGQPEVWDDRHSHEDVEMKPGGYCDYTAELVLGRPQTYPWGFVCAIEK
jgi:hypothetical protein